MSTMHRTTLTFLLLVTLGPWSCAAAQTAPQIGYLFPAGAQRGTQVHVTVGGKYMPGPCGVWTGPALAAQSPTTEGTVTLSVAADAAIGLHPLRIYSVQGGSAPRAFVVGDLPEIVEQPLVENRAVTLPVTVNGRLAPQGDVDRYRLSLSAGKQLICAVAARAIGSPTSAILRLRDAQGRIVARGEERRDGDPLLVYHCQEAGTFTLEIYDLNLAGGQQHVYRLTVTDGPYLDYAMPLAVRRGAAAVVTLYGWNLPGGATHRLTIDAAADEQIVHLPGGANRLTLPVSDAEEAVEAEPNDTAAMAQAIAAPGGITGRIQAEGDADAYKFAASKGDRFEMQVQSEALGFPADLVLTVSKGDGTLIKEIDDVGPARDPSFSFTAPADGDYLLTLTDRAARGGECFVYRLALAPPEPELRVSVKAAEFAVVPGETLTVPVRIDRLGGYAADLELTATGLPAGVTARTLKQTAKDKPDVQLQLQATADAPFSGAAFQIVARPVGEEPPQEHRAAATVKVSPSGATAMTVDQLWLAVGPQVPFELSVAATIQESPRLAAKPFEVRATRKEGFTGAIRLVGVDADARGTVVPLPGKIDEGAEVGGIPLIVQSMAVEGTTHRCRVMGVVDVTGPDGKLYPVFHVAKGTMLLGCQPNLLTLTAEPDHATRRPGETFDIGVTVMRRVAMDEVTVSLELPSGVAGIDAAPVTLARDQTHAVIRLSIAADDTLPPRVTATLRAASTRGGLPVYAEAPLVLDALAPAQLGRQTE